MFNVKGFTERNRNAFDALESAKGNISKEEYDVIYRALDDAKYTICTDYDHNTDGEVLGRLTEDAINSTCFDFNHFVQYLSERTHRYLQYKFWFCFITPFIKSMGSKKSTNMDQRNESACKSAKLIMDKVDIFNYVKIPTLFRKGYNGEDKDFVSVDEMNREY